MSEYLLCFTAPVEMGEGKGVSLGTPTLNLDISHVPSDLTEGIYVVQAQLNGEGKYHSAAMHFGERPTLGFRKSCEVHLLEYEPEGHVLSVTVRVLSRLRAVQDFGSEESLKQQIAQDVAKAKQLLDEYGKQ